MIDISNCKSLNDISLILYGKKNYYNREKVKQYLIENNIDWKEWKTKKDNKRKCLLCGKEIDGSKKFCNSSCAATYNNIKRGKRTNETKIKISNALRNKNSSSSLRSDEYLESLVENKKRFCLFCNKELKQRQRCFCSTQCSADYKKKKFIEEWREGKRNGIKGEYEISNYIRHYLLEKNNYRCEKCGWGEKNIYTNTIPLEIHHIDGDYSNNSEENLQILCPNCHSLTETHKSHNKKGRKTRNKNKRRDPLF